MRGERQRILFLTKYDRNGASSRYRFFQYMESLEAEGIASAVSPLFSRTYLTQKYRRGRPRLRDVVSACMRRLYSLSRARRFSLVVIEKEFLPYCPAWPEYLLRIMGVPYVADYDDALFHQYDQNPKRWVRRLLGNKIARVMRGGSLVTAGNRYLGAYAQGAGAGRVEILPTVVDLDNYPIKRHSPNNSVFTIGWIGSPTTAPYVEEIAPALARVCEGGRARVRLVGSGDVNLPGVPHEVIPWREGEEAEQLRAMDIGIMPMPDTPWERGKCGFKLIQYMACELPVVASPVGVNTEIVDDGSNGYLATDHDQWVNMLERLRNDAAHRRELGAAGRRKVERHYSLDVTAPRFASLLHEHARKVD